MIPPAVPLDIRSRVSIFRSLAILSILVVSCTPHRTLESFEKARRQIQEERRLISPRDGLRDLKGAIHVHSRLSWDSQGQPEDIIAAARAAGLQWLMTTDDNELATFTEGPQGWHDGVLIIRGVQVTQIHSAFLVFNLSGPVKIPFWEALNLHETLQAMIDLLKAKGGVVLIANPARFQDWSVTGYDGMEVYNVVDDIAEWKHLVRLPQYLLDVFYSYDRFSEDVFLQLVDHPAHSLARWDTLTRRHRIVGIAGSDAHQNVRVFGRQLDPYGLMFRVVTTHLLARTIDERALLGALQEGHAYVAFDLLADATGFRFMAEDDDRVAQMGDAVPLTPGLRFSIEVPHTGLLRIIKDGELMREARTDRWEAPVTSPGVYRVEVWLQIGTRWWPWILSNPIYVTSRT